VQGASLSNDQIFQVVDCAIQSGLVPYASNAAYHVLGASNIKATSGESHPPCRSPPFLSVDPYPQWPVP
jgi:hypothetical protein